VTSPASDAGSGSNLPDCVPTTRSTQSETWRAASPAATTGGGRRRLGPALLFIATAQLIVVLDATIMIIALLHIQRAPGFSGSGLRRDAAAGSGGIPPAGRCDPDTRVQK
jgi:hypothetical protein